MSTRPATPLHTAANRRSDQAETRARAALAVSKAGAVVSFSAIASAAGVSRQFLYTHPELRGEIEQLRDRQPDAARHPARERDGSDSLRTRLRAALDDNQRLHQENTLHRDELTVVRGQLREANAATRQRSKMPGSDE